MTKEQPKKDEICICGHPTSRHELYGTPYARCRLWMAKSTCNCDMQSRPVLRVVDGNLSKFKRTARGHQRPHALTGAVHSVVNYDEGQVEWLITECDKCGGPFQGDPRFYVLDEDGAIQRPGKPRTNGGTLSVDTGKHVAICALCDYEDMMLTGYVGPDRDLYR